MRFLVDECAGPQLANWLISQGHTVFSIYHMSRGMDDSTIIQKAFAEEWIVVTADKDFGTMIYRDKHPHHGVILLRLDDERASTKIATIRNLIEQYGELISGEYVVVTEDKVRFGKG